MPLTSAPARLADAPPASAKTVRVSAGRLLLEERATLRAMRADIRTATSAAVGDLSRLDDDTRPADDKRGVLLAMLLAASARMASALQRTVQDRRQAARRAATERLQRELAASSVRVTIDYRGHARLAEDALHAQGAADSLATAWRGGATAASLEALRSEQSPYRVIATVGEVIEARAGRTAATETAQSYADEHRRALEEWADTYDGATELLVRRWDAILDRRTCQACKDHDGELAAIGSTFDDGDEPGYVHVLCRCIPTVIAVPRH